MPFLSGHVQWSAPTLGLDIYFCVCFYFPDKIYNFFLSFRVPGKTPVWRTGALHRYVNTITFDLNFARILIEVGQLEFFQQGRQCEEQCFPGWSVCFHRRLPSRAPSQYPHAPLLTTNAMQSTHSKIILIINHMWSTNIFKEINV